MPGFLNIDTLLPLAIGFSFVLIRMAFLILTAPLFGSKLVPRRIVAASVCVFSFAVYMGLPRHLFFNMTIGDYIVSAFGEAVLGSAAGFGARIVFSAIESAGQVLGVPMGMGFSQVIDPLSNSRSVVTSRFLGAIVALVFLTLDIHHILLAYLVASFNRIPPGNVIVPGEVGFVIVNRAALIFSTAVQLAAPVLIVLLGIMFSLGMLARVAPKVNLFVLSFAISIGVGLIALRAALPNILAYTRTIVGTIDPFVNDILKNF
jgi:flagellar biosynthetic protein FliR